MSENSYDLEKQVPIEFGFDPLLKQQTFIENLTFEPAEKGTDEEFAQLTIGNSLCKIVERIEVVERRATDIETHRLQFDWFSFENRIRNIVVQLIEPTIQRQEVTRQKQLSILEIQSTMEKTIIAIENKINELTQEKVELFR